MRRAASYPVVSAVTLVLVLAACSGGGNPDAGGTNTAAPAPSSGLVSDSPNPSLSPSETGAPTGGTTGGAGTVTTGTTGAAGTATTGATGGTTTGGTKGWKAASLFTAKENTIGITKDKIVLCAHAALSLAPVFNVHPEDLNIYWEKVNASGGIFGRKVEISYTDDNYGNQPQDVRDAYLECKAKNPFILLGGIGFDQIPQVRAWVEEDHLLYIHHIARQDLAKRYSFSFLPSVEFFGAFAAQWIVKKHAGKKIGVVWRNSEHWEPGHKTFKAELAKRKVPLVKDLPVQKNATVFTTQINELQNANVEVVFVWENAVAATEIIKQADGQGYNPQWVIFPFNLTTETLKRDTTSPIAVEGIASWPAYVRGKTDGPFERYAAEIRRFEDAHERYGRGNRDDIVWMTWLGWKQLHRLLLQCGADCTRNKIVGLLQSGLHKAAHPLCPLDFARNKHVGGHSATVFRAFDIGSDGAAWKEVSVCKSGF